MSELLSLKLQGASILKSSKMKTFIWTLSANEASRVLRDLLDSDPTLMQKAYDTAVRIAEDVDIDSIADRVFFGLNSLDVDDLNSRAGRSQYGYVDPIDAAYELFEETLEPFVDEMKRNQKRSLPAAAKAYCIGIILGLWRYDEESNSDFAGWIEDAPGDYIDRVIEEWQKENPSSEDIAEVMNIIQEKQ